jgi:hypothetical protein
MRVTAGLLAVIGLGTLVVYCIGHPSGILHVIGVEPRTASTTYNFWSGIGSDLGEYAIATGLLAGLVHSYRRHNCRQHGCWRIGHRTYVDDTGEAHPACRHHHPLRHPPRFSFGALHARDLAAQHRREGGG